MEEQKPNPVKSPHVKTRAEAWKAWQAANIVKHLKIKPSAWSKQIQKILFANEKLLELFTHGVRPNRGEVQVQLRKDQSKVWVKITEPGWCEPRKWLVREDLPFYVHRQEIIQDLINSGKYRGNSYEGALLIDEMHIFERDTTKLWTILADAEIQAFLDNDPGRYIYVREFLNALPEEVLPAKPRGYVPAPDTISLAKELELDPVNVKLYSDLMREQHVIHELVNTREFQDQCDAMLEQSGKEKPQVEDNLLVVGAAVANERLDNALRLNQGVALDTMAVFRMLGGTEHTLDQILKRDLPKSKLVFENHQKKHFVPLLGHSYPGYYATYQAVDIAHEERLIAKLIEAYETFTGERLSRGRARDLIEALEMNGLDIRANED